MARSYIVHYTSHGVPRQSSRYGLRRDAEQRLKHLHESGRDGDAYIADSDRPPQVFPHCPGSGSQSIGGTCDLCGKVLTAADAAKWRAK